MFLRSGHIDFPSFFLEGKSEVSQIFFLDSPRKNKITQQKFCPAKLLNFNNGEIRVFSGIQAYPGVLQYYMTFGRVRVYLDRGTYYIYTYYPPPSFKIPESN